ncbi:MAG: DUF1295 domain-containing protein [Candidatus Thermoplasmatota archaeon]|nr:DUF1295 domain-containing protein [Candidatus Thermoplasmatota archaeon]
MNTISEKRFGLGSEHPLCDRIQIIFLLLFFFIWGIDAISLLIVGYSTVIIGIILFPLLSIPALIFFVLSFYLVAKSHDVIFSESNTHQKFIESGVYSWVRHPMYLGILLFCLGFLFLMVSILSIMIWIAFFIIYDRMATYEEKELIKILGNKYLSYQNRVLKWLPWIRIH